MRFVRMYFCRPALVWGVCLSFGSMIGGASVRAQETPQEQTQNPNPDVARGEVSSFDQFLDRHPGIDQQLTANPSLINDPQFLQQHPALQAFLNDHPNVKAEITENPTDFMRRERRFDGRERQRRSERSEREGQSGNPNPDLTTAEVANFDQFLDRHPGIDQQLTANPSLINNPQFLQQHPALQAYLNGHPNVKEEIVENPSYFMRRERRFDAAERQRANAGAQTNAGTQATESTQQGQTTQNEGRPGNRNPDLTTAEVANFDQFLDRHPGIDQQLTANPSLINNPQFLQQHPALQAYLNGHPNVKEEIVENPSYFMRRERRFDAAERQRANAGAQTNAGTQATESTQQGQTTQNEGRYEAPGNQPSTSAARSNTAVSGSTNTGVSGSTNTGVSGRTNAGATATANAGVTTSEVASFDQFLDDHKGLDKRLEKNPSLVNDSGFMKKHKNLEVYLNQHPAIREQLTANPSYFMNRENRYEMSAADRTADMRDFDRTRTNRAQERTRDTNNDRDDRDLDTPPAGSRAAANLTDKDVKETSKFLHKHKKIDKDLHKNPELVNDRDYLNKHKDLRAFLDKNPQVGQAMRSNPTHVMQNQERFEHMNAHAKAKQPPAQNQNKTRTEEKTERPFH